MPVIVLTRRYHEVFLRGNDAMDIFIWEVCGRYQTNPVVLFLMNCLCLSVGLFFSKTWGLLPHHRNEVLLIHCRIVQLQRHMFASSMTNAFSHNRSQMHATHCMQ